MATMKSEEDTSNTKTTEKKTQPKKALNDEKEVKALIE
jgi:hypothetical protein